MKATKEFIEQRFEHFNALIFDSALEPIPIRMTAARSYVAQFAFRRTHYLHGTELSNFHMRFSSLWDLSEQEWEDVIIHEMIHYSLTATRRMDTSAHGKLFRLMMDNINYRFDRHITISHSTTQQERANLVSTRRRWHYVAHVEFRDGRRGLKVLPNRFEAARRYVALICKSHDISAVTVKHTDDPKYNQYPCSTALNVVMLPSEK